MKIIAIVPAYNEAGNIELLIDQLREVEIDVIVINDKSTDGTLTVLKKMKVNYIDLPCNLGIGGAVQTGYSYAVEKGYDIAIQVDGDGQHDPKYINELIEPIINNQADMIIGSRYINKQGFQSTLIRRLGIRYFSILIKLLTGTRITDPTSGFRACNFKIMEYFSIYYPIDYPEPESITALLRQGYRIKEIPVEMLERRSGLSSINFLKSIYYMVKVTLAILIDIIRKNKNVEVM